MNPFTHFIARAAEKLTKSGKGQVVSSGPIILPTAQDRWTGATLAAYTPDRIETTIRGAMSGDLRAQWEMFDLMERTWPRLQGNLKKLKDAVVALEWELQCWCEEGQDPSEEATRRKRLLSAAIWNMRPDPVAAENDFADLIFDLADAWGKGISVQEIDWVTQPGPDGTLMVMPRAAWQVPVRFYGYPSDSQRPDRLMLRANELAKYRGGQAIVPATAADWVEFPADRFLIGIAKHKSGHPSASALLQPLGFFWAASNFSWEWFLNFAQLFGVPIRWANYAQGATDETIGRIEQMLTNMGSSAWAAFPEGTNLQILDAAKGSMDNPQAAIADRADTIADILILGQTLTTDAGDRGTQALGTVHKSVLTGRERALARWVAKTLNAQLVPAFCRLNFGDTREAPYFYAETEEEEDSKILADRDKILLDAGVEMPRRWFYERHGIPEPVEGEPVISGRSAVPAIPPQPGATPDGQADPNGSVAPADAQPSDTAAQAKAREFSAAQRRLADKVAEDVTGVAAEWLGGARPWFVRLVAAARNPKISDDEFTTMVERAAREVPDQLAPLLKPEALARALEAAMGASMVNGAVRGYLDREKAFVQKGRNGA